MSVHEHVPNDVIHTKVIAYIHTSLYLSGLFISEETPKHCA